MPNEVIDTENRELALDVREKELLNREIRVLARETLAAKGLSPEMGALIDYSNREACLKSIDTAEALIKGEVSRQVDLRLAGRGISLPGAVNVSEDEMTDREYYLTRMNLR